MPFCVACKRQSRRERPRAATLSGSTLASLAPSVRGQVPRVTCQVGRSVQTRPRLWPRRCAPGSSPSPRFAGIRSRDLRLRSRDTSAGQADTKYTKEGSGIRETCPVAAALAPFAALRECYARAFGCAPGSGSEFTRPSGGARMQERDCFAALAMTGGGGDVRSVARRGEPRYCVPGSSRHPRRAEDTKDTKGHEGRTFVSLPALCGESLVFS